MTAASENQGSMSVTLEGVVADMQRDSCEVYTYDTQDKCIVEDKAECIRPRVPVNDFYNPENGAFSGPTGMLVDIRAEQSTARLEDQDFPNAELQEEVTDLRGEIVKIIQDKDNHEESIAELEEEIVQAPITQVQEEFASSQNLEERNAELQRELVDENGNNVKMQERIAKLEKEIVQVKENLEEVAKNEDLQAAITQVQEEFTSFKESYRKLEGRYAELQESTVQTLNMVEKMHCDVNKIVRQNEVNNEENKVAINRLVAQLKDVEKVPVEKIKAVETNLSGEVAQVGRKIDGMLQYIMSRSRQESVMTAVGVFWDIENCCVPKGKSPLLIIQRIREWFFTGCWEAEFICVCDVEKMQKYTIKDLNAGQIDVIHINATAKNAADDKIRQCLLRFSESHPVGTKVILISSDVNFLPDLSDLRHRKKFHVVLVHKSQVSDALVSCANEKYLYEDLVKDIPDRPGRKLCAAPQLILYILVVYGYSKDAPLDKVRRRLKMISENCGGKVASIGHLFAILKFDTVELMDRAKKRMNEEDVNGSKITVCLPEDSPFNNIVRKMLGTIMPKPGDFMGDQKQTTTAANKGMHVSDLNKNSSTEPLNNSIQHPRSSSASLVQTSTSSTFGHTVMEDKTAMNHDYPPSNTNSDSERPNSQPFTRASTPRSRGKFWGKKEGKTK